jgi:hypothetical protein
MFGCSRATVHLLLFYLPLPSKISAYTYVGHAAIIAEVPSSKLSIGGPNSADV